MLIRVNEISNNDKISVMFAWNFEMEWTYEPPPTPSFLQQFSVLFPFSFCSLCTTKIANAFRLLPKMHAFLFNFTSIFNVLAIYIYGQENYY